MAEIFWQTPQGKVQGYLQHEVVNSTSLLICRMRNLKEKLEKDKNVSLTNEEARNMIDLILNRCKRIDDAVDYTYLKVKELAGF